MLTQRCDDQVNVPAEGNVSQLRLPPLLFSSNPDMKGGRPKRQQRRVDLMRMQFDFQQRLFSWVEQHHNNSICVTLKFVGVYLLMKVCCCCRIGISVSLREMINFHQICKQCQGSWKRKQIYGKSELEQRQIFGPDYM